MKTTATIKKSIIVAAFLIAATAFTSQAALQVNYPDGAECQPLIAGQHIEAGEVCVEIQGPNLAVTYNMSGDWELLEAHLWAGLDLADMPANKKGNPKIGHFPYATGDITGASSFTFNVSLEEAFGSAEPCDVSGLLAGHAAVRRDNGDGGYQTETGWIDGEQIVDKGSWAMFSSVEFTCPEDDVVLPPVVGSTETAYAFGDASFCDDFGLNRWGWELFVPADLDQPIVTPIYAGAGQCDISKGTEVGELVVTRDGTVLTVSFEMFGGFNMTETHLYVGGVSLVDTGLNPAAPGQYGLLHDLAGAGSDSYAVVLNTDGPVYVVAHAVVAGF